MLTASLVPQIFSSFLAAADTLAAPAADAVQPMADAEPEAAAPADGKDKKKGRKKKGAKAAVNEDDDLDALLAEIEGKQEKPPTAEAAGPAAAPAAGPDAADASEDAGEPETEGKVGA